MKFNLLERLAGRVLLVLLLSAGLLLVWGSLQTFGTISALVNALAPDGNLESFTPQRFHAIALPAGLLGSLLTVLPILAILYWKRTVAIIAGIKAGGLRFLQALPPDWKIFSAALGWRTQPTLDRVALAGITLLAILPRLADLNASISHDEAYTYNAFASVSLWTTISDYHLPNNHVLLSILINITVKLIGNQPWMLRLPSLAAGVLMIPAVYFLARRLYSRDTAILAAAMVALFPKLVEYSSVARGYILLELIALCLLGLGDYLRENKNHFAWLLLAVFSALGFYTIPIMIFPFGAIFFWMFLSALFGDVGDGYSSRLDFLKYWFWAGIGAALLTIFLYAPILLKDADLFFNNRFVHALDWNGYFPVIMERLFTAWGQWTSRLPAWLVQVSVTGFALSLVFHKWIAKHKVPTQAAFFLWVVAVLAYRRPNAEPKVWSFLIAFLLIWMAAGVVESLKKMPFFAKRGLLFSKGLLAGALALLLISNILVAPGIPQKWSEKKGIDIVASFLKEELQEDDLVIVGVTYAPQLTYLFDIHDIPQEHIRHAGPYERAFVIISPRAGGDLERVLDKFAPASPALDRNSLTLVKKFGAFEIYQALPVP